MEIRSKLRADSEQGRQQEPGKTLAHCKAVRLVGQGTAVWNDKETEIS